MTLDTNTIINGFAVAVAVGIYGKISRLSTDVATLVGAFHEHTVSDIETFDAIRADLREVRRAP